MFTSNLIERIGLDRTVLSGFRIISIDFEKLLKCDNAVIDREGKFTYLLNNGESFRWMKIEDRKMFGTLCAGVKKEKYFKIDYARIDICIGNSYQSNLQNLTVIEYKQRIKEVFHYLCDVYGVVADMREIRLSEMEINCTFQLKGEFFKYHRVLRLMMFNLPKSFRKMGQVQNVNKKENRLESETFYRGNTLTEIKLYDKAKQLEDTGHFVDKENIIRIEFVLKKPQKIREVFNSALAADLSDKKINEFYYEQFIKLFEKPYQKWEIENGKQLMEMIICHKRKSKRYWKSNLLRECANREQIDQIPVLLDVKHLLIQVKALDKDGHYKRVENGILKQCNYNDIYLQDDSDKIKEILDRVHEIYNNYENNVLEHDSVICGDVA